MAKNLFGTSEFASAIAALGKGVLAGQPNATQSGAWRAAEHTDQYARGLAMQQAQKKAEKKAKKKKKGALGGSIGGILGGIALAPFTGGMSLAGAAALTGAGAAAGNLAGSAIAGGDPNLGGAAMAGGSQFSNAGGFNAMGNKMMTRSTIPVAGNEPKIPLRHPYSMTSDGSRYITKPKRYAFGSALANMGGGKALGGEGMTGFTEHPNPDGTMTIRLPKPKDPFAPYRELLGISEGS